MRVTIIPGLGHGSRIREIREDGDKLLLDVAGRPAVKWQLDFVLPDICVVACHHKHVHEVRAVVGAAATVIPYKAYDEPWGLARFMQDVTRHLDEDIALSLLFCDTLFMPGTDYTALTIPGTLVVADVEDGGRFLNVVDVDTRGFVTEWTDHPYDGEPAVATVGLYTLPVREWRQALEASDEDNAGYKFIERARFTAIHTDAWLDIGTPESYRETCARLTSCA